MTPDQPPARESVWKAPPPIREQVSTAFHEAMHAAPGTVQVVAPKFLGDVLKRFDELEQLLAEARRNIPDSTEHLRNLRYRIGVAVADLPGDRG